MQPSPLALSEEKPAQSSELPALILQFKRLGIQAFPKAGHHLVLLISLSKKGMAVGRPTDAAVLPSYGFSPHPAMSLDGPPAIWGPLILLWLPHCTS